MRVDMFVTDVIFFSANKLMNKILRECPKGNGLLSKMQSENMSQIDIQRIVADLILAASDTVSIKSKKKLP